MWEVVVRARNRSTGRTRAVVATLAAIATSLVLVGPAPAGAAGPPLAGAVIVEVAADADPVAVAVRAGVTPDLVFDDAPKGFSARTDPTGAGALARDAAVVSVRRDRIVGRVDPGRRTPAPEQPAQVVRAAQTRVGLLASPTADVDGRNDRPIAVDVAVLDGGIDRKHPDLRVAGGVSCQPDRSWADRDGHGTMVAGLVGAVDNKIGIAGIAPGARLWAVRIADESGYISDSALECGLRWLLKHRHVIDVANFSFGDGLPVIGPCGKVGGVVVDRHHALVCRAVAAGITVVASAGNESRDAALAGPAAYPEVITVSAFAETDGLPGGAGPLPCLEGEVDDGFATFSNFGAVVDISAPGVCVTSTFPGGLYAFGSGTSFSAPFVSGAAALVLATRPGATPARVRSILLAAAEPGPIAGDPDAFPEGVLNVARL